MKIRRKSSKKYEKILDLSSGRKWGSYLVQYPLPTRGHHPTLVRERT